MATINSVGVGLSGASGTGSFAGTTSPTFVTPTLGVATATSIGFGGNTIQTYIAGATFSPLPTITAATMGDLSVSYSVQTGTYTKIGILVMVNIALTFTPTFTTATGNLQISNMPFAGAATGYSINVLSTSSNMVWPVGRTQMCGAIISGTTNLILSCFGSAVNASNFAITNLTSGVATAITLSGLYRTSTA